LLPEIVMLGWRMMKRSLRFLGLNLMLILGTGASALLQAQAAPAAPAAAPSALGGGTVNVSFYTTRLDGRRTASTQRFSSKKLTAAHRTLPFGTKVKLTNPDNGKTVTVRVNDRGPFVDGREISVTRRAARTLGIIHQGVAPLTMEVLN
jgi:rare lipoprotein A